MSTWYDYMFGVSDIECIPSERQKSLRHLAMLQIKNSELRLVPTVPPVLERSNGQTEAKSTHVHGFHVTTPKMNVFEVAKLKDIDATNSMYKKPNKPKEIRRKRNNKKCR